MNKEDKKEKLKKYQVYVFALFLVVSVIGITYAAFVITRDSGENTITTGQISMSYREPDNAYVVEDALPIKDSDGIGINNYFEFEVSTHARTNEDDNIGVTIPYNVTLGKLSIDTGKKQLLEKEIKVYITKVESGVETVVLQPTLISNLALDDENNYIALTASNTHKNGSESVTTTYRLRAWIDYGVEASNFTTDNRYQYKFNVNINSKVNAGGGTPSVELTGNLANNWRNYATSDAYLAVITLDTKTLPAEYTIDFMGTAVTFAKNTQVTEKDVSEQQNGSVVLGEYLDTMGMGVSIAILGQDGGVVAPVDSSSLFGSYTDPSTATASPCAASRIMDLSNLDVSNVEDMSFMFSSVPIMVFDVSGWDTSKVKDMSYMFYYSSSVTELDINHFNTSNVENMEGMFMYSGELLDLKIDNFKTGKVTNMRRMFMYCYKLGNMDLSEWSVSNVTNMEQMFYETGKSTSDFNIGELGNWDISNVNNMNYMFSKTGERATTFNIGDLCKWDLTTVTNKESMFFYTGYSSGWQLECN